MKESLLLVPILLPLVSGVALYFGNPASDRRRAAFVCAAVLATSLMTWALILFCGRGVFVLFRFFENVPIEFAFDGLGRFFAGIVSLLWPAAAFYALSYMKYEPRKNTFYAFFLMAYSATLGISMSGSMMTLYLFYELLTLTTLPLIMHGMSKAAVRAGRIYLYYSIGGAAFAFIGLIFLIKNGGAGAFRFGGIMGSPADPENRLLAVYVLAFLGFGVKAAVCPVNAWLPRASIAAMPVTALLHAVAVVKAGVFSIIRLTYFSYGTKLLVGTWAQKVVMALAVFTIVYGSAMAVRQTHIKRRLAYSTIANLSYILFGVTLMNESGLTAGLLHMANHAVIKILAFFAVGAIMHDTGREYVYEMDGLGKRMPVTFFCFTAAALSLTGIPPLSGFLSKWLLLSAALLSDSSIALAGAAALLLSALLTAVYMLSIPIRAFFPPKGTLLPTPAHVHEADALMLVPMLLITLLMLLMGLFSDPLLSLCTRIASGGF